MSKSPDEKGLVQNGRGCRGRGGGAGVLRYDGGSKF